MSEAVTIETLRPNGTKEIAIAAITPYEYKPAINYLNTLTNFNNYIDGSGSFSEPLMKECILLCNKLYLLGGIAGSACDIMLALANTIMEIETDNEEFNKVIAKLLDRINMDNSKTMMGYWQLNQEILMDLIINGTSFPYISWRQFKANNKSYLAPTVVSPLNPLNVYIQPTADFLGEMIYYMNGSFNYSGSRDINKTNDGIMNLKPFNLRKITRHGRQYFWWGIPYLTRAFTALADKEKLKALDDATTNGLIHLITIFSLYDEKNGVAADKEVCEAFVAALNNQPGKAKYLAWGGQVKDIVVGPSNEILKMADKYKNSDKDIIDALAIPYFLISGSMQGGTAGADLSTKPFKAMVEELKKALGSWWKSTIFRMADENNIDVNIVEVRFAATDLDDDAKLVAKVNNMRDRGLLSDTSSALMLRVSSNLEEYLVNKEREKQTSDPSYKFGTPPPVPFQGEAGLAPGQSSPSTKQGGNGRPKASDPSSKIKDDSTKQIETQTKRKMGIKANMLEIASEFNNSLFDEFAKDDLNKDSKLALPLTVVLQLGTRIASEYEISSRTDRENIMKELNKYSLEVQTNLLNDMIDKEKAMAKLTEAIEKIDKMAVHDEN